MRDFAEIWGYLAQGPLVWLTATLVAYIAGDTLSKAANRAPLANPVLIAVALLAGMLWASDTPYPVYFEGAQFVHFLLGPATVALALPLHANLDQVRRSALPLAAALIAGSVTAIASVILTARALGIEGVTLISLVPKSTTAPVAIGISESLGGSPTLTAVLVLLTGVTGAIVATPLLNLLRIRDWRARGFAVGVAAHGLGTARALQVNPTAGAFAGIGMGLNAMLTALIAPALLRLFQ
ncbi:MAG: LrgB family protein [Gemmobacter sp.]|nr:LrgB family protein [Gemmobacter sp.]